MAFYPRHPWRSVVVLIIAIIIAVVPIIIERRTAAAREARHRAATEAAAEGVEPSTRKPSHPREDEIGQKVIHVWSVAVRTA